MSEGVVNRKQKVKPTDQKNEEVKIEKIVEKEEGKKGKTSWLSDWQIDILLVVLLLCLSSNKLLWKLGEPNDIVWDETHFTKFSTWYTTGHYFVDIHPPLAKLIMAGTIWLSGYEPLPHKGVQWWTDSGFEGTLDYENIYKDDTYYYVRLASVVMGNLLVVISYLTLRKIGCRKFTSFFGTWMILTDTLITIDSRLILTDIYLWTFQMLTVFFSVCAAASKTPFSQKLFSILTGIFLGFTVSVKYTALGVCGFVVVHQTVFVFYIHYRLYLTSQIKKFKLVHSFIVRLVAKLFTIAFFAILIFLLVWHVHLSTLPYHGQGTAFMESKFSRTLSHPLTREEWAISAKGGCPNSVNSEFACGAKDVDKKTCQSYGCCWDPSAPYGHKCYTTRLPSVAPLPWFVAVYEVLHATWANNQGASLNYHPQMSRWWEWPLLTCRLVDFGFGIHSIGNVVTWWTVAFFMPITAFFLFFKFSSNLLSKTRDHVNLSYELPSTWFLFVGVVSYLGNWIPYYFIVRSTWNYHYVPALLFAILTTAVLLDNWISSTKKTRLLKGYILISMVLMLAAFIYWSPWVYGPELSEKEYQTRKWHEKWDPEIGF